MPITIARLARLLIVLRLRSWRGRLKAGPKVAAARLAALFALAVPAAYVGLLLTALTELGVVGGRAAQEAALALVTGVIATCSLATKVAGGDLVVGRGGEIELLLAHPVSLPALVVARGLAGICTDLFGALFLLPVLAAAAVVWRLPAVALLLAVAISVLVQIAISALAQAAQIIIVRLVPEPHRRTVFVLAALLAAAGMAGIWMAGSGVLRAADAAAALLNQWRSALVRGPGGWMTAPLRWLEDDGQGAGQSSAGWGIPLPPIFALLGLAAGAVASLLLAALVARAAAARGWEQAGPPWADRRRLRRTPNARGTRGPFSTISLAGKDWRQLVRDRARLVTMLALPTLFIGAQVFGSAGWGVTSASPTRLAICAFSLAAYAATFGPLVHLEAERRAFWILRAVPVSIARLFAHKAGFWSLALGGYAAVVYGVLGRVAGFAFDGVLVTAGALAVLGAVLVSWLAVGLGAAEADLSDDQRSALGIGTAYLFMVVSGLFNLVIVAEGADRLRAFALFAIATAIAFSSGVSRARDIFDPEALAARRLSPVAGALGMILLFLGARAIRLLGTGFGHDVATAFDAGWLSIVAAFAAWHWLRNRGLRERRRFAATVALVVVGGVAAFAAVVIAAVVIGAPVGVHAASALLQVLTQELLARGIVQPALATEGSEQRPSAGARAIAAAASIALVATVMPTPVTAAAVAAAIGPAVVLAFTQRFSAALVTRLVVEALGRI
jgi:hypothetical protein